MFVLKIKKRMVLLGVLLFSYIYKKYGKYIFFLYFKNTQKGIKYIEKNKEKALNIIKNKLFSKNFTYNFKNLPKKGLYDTDIKKIIINRKSIEGNKVSGCIYNNDKESKSIINYVNNLYLYSNPLHPDIYPELIKMETEIIKMIGNLFDLPETGGGNLTTGGTESTILALKAYKKNKKNKMVYNFVPEVLCTKTVHAAVNKACELLDLKIINVKLDKNYKMDIDDLKKKINYRSCVIVVSYPCFAYGICDPIDEISEIAGKMKVPLHVDACLGGFITQFNKEKRISFNSNIQSISIDPHKFGYSPKGSSILLWKSRKMKHNQYFIKDDWTGGIYASVSLPGSRVGSQIATTWASILYFGYESYKRYSSIIIEKTNYLKNNINSLDTFKVIGNPSINVVAFYSKKYKTGQILDFLSKEGWNLNILQNPICLHLCITPKNINNIDNFILSLKKILNENVNNNFDNIVSIYGLSANIPDKSIIKNIINEYLDMTTNI